MGMLPSKLLYEQLPIKQPNSVPSPRSDQIQETHL